MWICKLSRYIGLTPCTSTFLITVTDVFNIDALENLEVLVTRKTEQMESFLDTHFYHQHFISMDMEYHEGLTCTRVVDGVSTELLTVDIAALQFCVDHKVLIVLIHNNSMQSYPCSVVIHSIYLVCPRPVQLLLQDPLMWKYGVGIVGDVSMLMKFMNICPRSCFDIGHIAKTVHAHTWLAHDKTAQFHTPLSLQTLCEAYLQHKIDKPDWASIYASSRDKSSGPSLWLLCSSSNK